MSKGHIHAALMAQYAEDAATHEKPWLFWESYSPHFDGWYALERHPDWVTYSHYRRKPLTKPSIVWNHVHKDYRFLAQDKNGHCYLYKSRPTFSPDDVEWHQYNECVVEGWPFASLKPGTCNWRESLVERPEGE